MIRIISSFAHTSDSDLAVEAQHIVNCFTGNANFITPAPAIADVQTAVTDYEAALVQASQGGKQFTIVKNQKRAALEALLGQLALYVQLNCNNDGAIALTSGFSLAKTHAPIGSLPKPENLKVAATAPGTADLQVQAVPHAAGYVWQYKLSTDTLWTETHTTKASVTVTGLTSGLQYSFRVTALGSNPTRNWSDEIKSFVL